ncbi:MAG: hypothetical protein P1U68_03090 [Verrucomicrobiales bacterium]|nr:hypothetical protein [Verrucomicrobiales bacterium]
MKFISRLKKFLQRHCARTKQGEILQLGSKILVIGDSHVRSYARNVNFFPVFLGQGRLHNFTSDEYAENYRVKAERILRNTRSNVALLVLGEPDARHSLGLGWLPWERSKADQARMRNRCPSIMRVEVEKSAQRICSLFTAFRKSFPETRLISVSLHPVQMEEQNMAAQLLNELLAKSLGEDFFDLTAEVESLRKALIDPVHHSGAIQPVVERALSEQIILTESRAIDVEEWDAEEVRSLFQENSQFGCFVPKL